MNTRPDPRPLHTPESVAWNVLDRLSAEQGRPLDGIVRTLVEQVLYLTLLDEWSQEDNFTTTELLVSALDEHLPELTDEEVVDLAANLDIDPDDLAFPYYEAHNRAMEAGEGDEED